MALQTENQWLIGKHFIRQHITVITNIAPDHLDEIGEDREETARTLALSIFPGSVIVTFEPEFDKYTDNTVFPGSDVPEDLSGQFSFPVYKRNVALVLAVCDLLRLPREAVCRGMLKTKPDIGMQGMFFWKGYAFVNAFAANDPESFLQALASIEPGPYLLIYNHREDRSRRLMQIAEALRQAPRKPIGAGMIGQYRKQAAAAFSKRSGVNTVPLANPLQWLETMRPLGVSMVLCAGNIKGDGQEFLCALTRKGEKYA
jgi:UDP-N-acetylmuramoylalanine-D-glutamate ligase